MALASCGLTVHRCASQQLTGRLYLAFTLQRVPPRQVESMHLCRVHRQALQDFMQTFEPATCMLLQSSVSRRCNKLTAHQLPAVWALQHNTASVQEVSRFKRELAEVLCFCDKHRCTACRSRRLCSGKSMPFLHAAATHTPPLSSLLQVHYSGTLEDGSVFDSSLEREPLAFEVGGGKVIPGFDDAVMGLAEGEKRKQLVPAERAYGKHPKPSSSVHSSVLAGSLRLRSLPHMHAGSMLYLTYCKLCMPYQDPQLAGATTWEHESHAICYTPSQLHQIHPLMCCRMHFLQMHS